ncbi:MAG: metallophosphoesterase family protein [Candidatus Odinarchaeota archaeon]
MPQTIKSTILIITLLTLTIFSPLRIISNRIDAQSPLGFTFIAYGDTRGGGDVAVSPIHSEMVLAYMQQNPDFIIHTGDMVNRGGIWNQWLSFNSSIQPIWDAGISLFGVVGNHEKYTDEWDVFDENFTQYKRFFNFSSVIDTPGETELHYSFNYGGIHFIILNTEDYFDYGSETYNCSQPQMDWLLNDLANTQPSDFIVASYHRPAWSVNQNRVDRWTQAETIRHEFHQLFVQYGVDLVFHGHDHYYYRYIRDDIYYVVTGGGGASLYTPDPTAPQWQEGDVASRNYHYCKIDVNPTQVTVTVMQPDNTTIDFFAINKSSAISPIPIELQLIIVVSLCGCILLIGVIIYLVKRRRL